MSRLSNRVFGPNTRAIHGGQKHDPATGSVVPPIYAKRRLSRNPRPACTRGSNMREARIRPARPSRQRWPTRKVDAQVLRLHRVLRRKQPCSNLSRMEVMSWPRTISTVAPGAYSIASAITRPNLAVAHVDTGDLDAIEAAITPRTALIWVETPSNPLLRLADLGSVAAIARRHQVLTVVDNTFASPAVQRPLDHGIDIVVHSVTKYIGGHSDIIGGGVVLRDDPELISRLRLLQNTTGGILDPFSSFLGLRGIKTLPLRIERHAANALAIANWLESHPKIERVVYPGLKSHPQHDLAKRQMKNGGGMVSVFLKADQAQAISVLERFELFALAESLGGIESLVGHPSIMSHGSVPEERRAALGITPNLLRLSVGIEDADDLIADLERALSIL
jgi:cystathionine gamma-lyase